MQHNQEMQRYMDEEAEHVKLSMLGDQSKEKVEVSRATLVSLYSSPWCYCAQLAATKRKAHLNTFKSNVESRNRQELQEWASRAVKMENESKIKERNDRLKQLSVSYTPHATVSALHSYSQRLVSHQEEIEHSLYTQAKQSDSEHKKQTGVVEKMQQQLDALKRDNARRLKAR